MPCPPALDKHSREDTRRVSVHLLPAVGLPRLRQGGFLIACFVLFAMEGACRGVVMVWGCQQAASCCAEQPSAQLLCGAALRSVAVLSALLPPSYWKALSKPSAGGVQCFPSFFALSLLPSAPDFMYLPCR